MHGSGCPPDASPLRGFIELPTEREIQALWESDFDTERDLQAMFQEPLAYSLAKVLSESGRRAIMLMIGATNLSSPRRVASDLDSIFLRGSEVLKKAIAKEFQIIFRQFWAKGTIRASLSSWFLQKGRGFQ